MGAPFSDITVYYHSHDITKEKEFTSRHNIVSDLYVRFLNGYKPPKTSRISISLIKKEETRREPWHFGSILLYEVYFDEDKFWDLNHHDQKKMILDLIHKTAIDCAAKFGWDSSKFEEAYKNVINNNLEFHFEEKIVCSKDRKHKASIQITKDEMSAAISVIFYDNKNKKLKTVRLLNTIPLELIYAGLVKRRKWFNNFEFGLELKNGQIIIKASLEKVISEIQIIPEHSTLESLQGTLKFITIKEGVQEDYYKKWLQYTNTTQ